MITFIVCLSALVVAYFTYGRVLERVAEVNSGTPTPAQRLADGVDFIRMPRWKVFLIQLLNIAGTGPIFGAILGACFGPVAFLWITLGGIFFGAMHDFLSGMMILRADGRSLPEVLGSYLGEGVRQSVRWFSILLLILVGAVFMLSPAELLGNLVPGIESASWVWIILAYYVIATVLPVDKVIGRLYPIFGAALIFMALGLLAVILFENFTVPELSFHNYQLDPRTMPVIPTMFITIACGAISGFHATQSPMMARCVGNEKECRSVFYGSMITESIIALIWAAIAMAFFGGPSQLGETLVEHGNNPAWAVDIISRTTLGKIGAILAILGVVAAPITSGDTAFRSARLIIADIFGIEQRTLWRRFAICLPLFAVAYVITMVNFGIVWRYFAWANQTLAVFTLWAIVVWLRSKNKCIWIGLVPAVAMTYIVVSFVFISGQFLDMGPTVLAYSLSAAICALPTYLALRKSR